MSITPKQIRQFDEDGFLILDRILTEEQTEKAQAAVQRILRGEAAHDRRPAEYRRHLPRYPERSEIAKHWVNGRFLDDDLWDISTDPRIGQMAATLLRTPEVSLMEDQLFEKTPGGRPVALHQDDAYLPFLRTWDTINLWVALTDTTEEMSPLLLLRGSHKWGKVAEKPTKFSNGDESDMLEVAAPICPPGAKMELVPTVVPAGGGVFHHAWMLHGSYANFSDRVRYAYTMHFAAESVRVRLGHWPANYEPYIVEGIQEGGRPISALMPVVYPARK